MITANQRKRKTKARRSSAFFKLFIGARSSLSIMVQSTRHFSLKAPSRDATYTVSRSSPNDVVPVDDNSGPPCFIPHIDAGSDCVEVMDCLTPLDPGEDTFHRYSVSSSQLIVSEEVEETRHYGHDHSHEPAG